jgi:hypothetical protein
MKKLVILWFVIVFSLFTCLPAYAVNQNVMLIKIFDEVQALKEKSALQEQKLNEILKILSKKKGENQEKIIPRDEESLRLLKEIRGLLWQLKNSNNK